MAVDFVLDKFSLYINGQKSPPPSSKLRPLTGKMSDAKDLPLIVRMGHYYFDNKPIIGRMVDINMWDRYTYYFIKN